MSEMIPLPEAALRLGWPWNKAFNACLRGDLRAVRAENGRWTVDASDVARLSAKRDTAAA
jgi:hypothetical protein